MDIPTVVINEPDMAAGDNSPTDDEDESGNSSCGNSKEFDFSRLHPRTARTRKIGTTSLQMARQRRISRSESNLHGKFHIGHHVRVDNVGDDNDSDDESEDSSDDDIPALPPDRRHTIGVNSPDAALLREKLEHLKNLRKQICQSGSNQHCETAGEPDMSQKRNSIGLSLPKKTLQKLRAKIGNKSQSNSQQDDLDRILSRRRHTFGVIPQYALPKRKHWHKAVKENDDALNALLRRRRKISQTSSFPGSRSRKRSSSSQGQGSMSRKTSQCSLKAEEDEKLLKLDRQSALLQMMLNEEIERQAQAPAERERLLEGVSASNEDVGPVRFFTHELSFRGRLRRFFIRNPTTRLVSTFFDLAVKIIICSVYVVRVCMDSPGEYACNGHPCQKGDNDSTEAEQSDIDSMKFSSSQINWYVLLWVNRPLALWIVEVVLAFISLFKDLLFIYITTKGHRLEQVMTNGFLLELLCTIPMLITVVYPPLLQHLFVPNFLNCWLGKRALERIFNDLHLTRQRFQTISVTLSQQMVMLLASLICLIFTTICGIQHIQRGSSESPLTMFESLYFVIVTFSTVGYGDISPDIWLGQVFIMIMIIVAFTFIPRQVEVLASTWLERQKVGGEYSRRAAMRNKHVIVCATSLTQETVMDFLNEFYAHPKLEEHMVILLCPQELDSSMQVILKDPKWTHRVIYMKGSALKDIDLKRCRLNQAEACFFLAPRPTHDKDKADQHTVLRSWAVKDFAPHCKQYIQLFKAKNKMHVKFAEHLVCEDEFKYALLANNCLYPGLSTLVSLLVHTSSGLEGDLAPHPWQQIYGRHSGNEIYHIQLCKSAFFSGYEGYRFTQASAEAHQRFGVTLLAVLVGDGSTSRRLQLNPGSDYILKKEDFCFYMSMTREEYTEISPQALAHKPSQTKLAENLELIAEALQKYQNVEVETESEEYDVSVFDTITSLMGKNITRSIQQRNQVDKEPLMNNNLHGDAESRQPLLSSPAVMETETEVGNVTIEVSVDLDANTDSLDEVDHRHGAGKVLQYYNDMGQEKLATGPPPVTIYMGSHRAVCHIMREPRPFCCLEWGTDCEHCTYKNANDERWHHQLIIIAAQKASSGIHNFVVPLRSSFIAINGLSPIVLLLETDPDSLFLDTIAQFPLVYWMRGSITTLDDMLKAGINKASHLVVVNRESHQNMTGEETLADAETIIAVQTVFRMFPNANIITELSQASNMRFMQFSAQDIYLQKVSRLEQKLKETMTSNLNHIFRMPFAAGQVFSASMLDTLLYQTFVKGYLITFVRLLLGIDAEEGSGHLSSIRIKRSTLQKFPTYGELYQGLCSATGEIPIAVYRTERNSVALKADSVQQEKDMSFGWKKGKKKKQLSRKPSHTSNPFAVFNKSEMVDIGGLVRNRLKSLDMSANDYSEEKKRPNTISYIIANPSPKRKLKVGDIIYVIQPSSMEAKPSKQKFWLHRSHSFSGTIQTKPEASGALATSATVYAPIRTKRDIFPGSADAAASAAASDSPNGSGETIGRFKLKRYNSEKKASPLSAERPE